MKLDKVLFLAAYTPRSQAYAQALSSADLHPAHAIFFGKRNVKKPGQANVNSEGIEETARKNGWDGIKIEEDDVNSAAILENIKRIGPDVVIYSGYGGQIVGKDLLNTGIQFLHMHAGWLPDYRGSTTLYYSLLKESACGVSAIFMSDRIDEGAIAARKKYPAPPAGIDIDYVYDGMIRADMLVIVLKEYAKTGSFKKLTDQHGGGTEYYVMHPVLKHIAILSCEKKH